MKPNFLLIFILGLYLSLIPSLSSASSLPAQLPEGLPDASFYNTLVLAGGEGFATNDGILYVFYKDSSIATQFGSPWQEGNQREYDATHNDRAGRTVINLGEKASAQWARSVLAHLGNGSIQAMVPPTDPRHLIEAHYSAHLWNLESDEKSLREAFSALLKTNEPYCPFYGMPFNVKLQEWSEEKEAQEKINAPKKPFNLLHAAFFAENHVLAELAAIKCLGNIPLHFGCSRWSKEFHPEVLERLSPPLLIKLLNVVRGVRGGDIKSLLRLLQAWRAKIQYPAFDTEILPHFPFEKVSPELAAEVEGAFSSYLEPNKEEMSVFLRSPLSVRVRPEHVVMINAMLPNDTAGGGYVMIEPGQFMMGSPDSEVGRSYYEVQHRVRLSTAYALKATPVTEKEWQALMGNNPSRQFENRPAGESADECPVQEVSWFDAVAYCNRLSVQEGLAPYYLVSNETGTPGAGNYSFESYVVNPADKGGYRLPSEAEWERGARGDSAGAMYVANDLRDTIAWSRSNSDLRTHPVAKLVPNSYGLYDMLGNVYEWTGDFFGDLNAVDQIDPQGPHSGRDRVFRGGCFLSPPGRVRAAHRRGDDPSFRCDFLGFRPARSLQN